MYRAGAGPAVIVIHEIPGIHPGMLSFAQRLLDGGYTVNLPSLFGRPGQPASTGAVVRSILLVCVGREFAILADRTSPVVTWLRALAAKVTPVEVTTDKAPAYPAVLEELLPASWHRTDRYANNRVECDHGRLKARLGPMRGLKQDRSARAIIARHAFVQNLRRGHYELAVDGPTSRRVAARSTNWSWRSDPSRGWPSACPGSPQRNSAPRDADLGRP